MGAVTHNTTDVGDPAIARRERLRQVAALPPGARIERLANLTLQMYALRTAARTPRSG